MNETPEAADDELLPKYAYAELVRLLQTEEQGRFAKLAQTFNVDDEIEDALKKYRRRHQTAGKILCAARSKWEEVKQTKYGTRQSFPDFFQSRYGCRPSNRGQSCAKTYRVMVLTGKIEETDYDENVLEAILITCRIITKVKDEKNHAAVAEAALILHRRSSSATKQLEDLYKRLITNENTGQVELLDNEQFAKIEAPPIGYAPALELASKIVKEGNSPVLGDALATVAASTTDLREARTLAVSAAKIKACLMNNRDEHGKRRFSDEVIDTWMAPEGPVPTVSVASLKADYVAAKGRMQQMENKLKDAGIAPPQLPVLPQPAVPNFIPVPVAESDFDPVWRKAEKVVLKLLRKKGWQVDDVSGQKAGCDFKGRTSEGEEVFVDVKLISRPNEPFTLTDDEMLLAREKGGAYRVALVRLTITHLEVAFICDPASKLEYKKKFRAVYWEFAEYEFRPALMCPLE